MSEYPFMQEWPGWQERTERLVESIDIIKRLWNSDDYFSYQGKYFRIPNIYLYLKPRSQIPIYFSAIGEKAAYAAGMHGDRLMTVATLRKCKDVIFPKFEEGALKAGRNPDEILKSVSLGGGIGPAKDVVKRIRKLIAGGTVTEMFNEPDPKVIEERGTQLTDEQILSSFYVADRGEELIEVFSAYQKIGADQIIWGDLSPEPEKMMKTFKDVIIPYFRDY